MSGKIRDGIISHLRFGFDPFLSFIIARQTLTLRCMGSKIDVKVEPTAAPLLTASKDERLISRDKSWQIIRVLIALVASVPISGAVVFVSVALFAALSVVICAAGVTALALAGGFVFCLCSVAIGFCIIVSSALWLLAIFLFVVVSLTPVAAITAFLLSLDPRNADAANTMNGNTHGDSAEQMHWRHEKSVTFAAFRRNVRDIWTSYVRGY